MAISRRQFVKLLGTISAGSPVILSACAGDDPEVFAGDGGIDATADAGMADTGMMDAGDVASDSMPDAGPIYTDDDWTMDPIEPDSLPAYEFSGTPGPAETFAMGVASGDPTADAVILWTHVSSPETDEVTVWWEIARDPGFVSRVQVGEVVTSADRGFTVKVDVTDLLAGRPYYYRFMTAGQMSPIGRTRTAPAGNVRNLRFAVCSCASYTSGYYHAYRSIAERADLHAVIHLGDYIYEGGGSGLDGERVHVPAFEIRTLDDYRTRYMNYRSDSDLQEVHRQHPFICVWDDHETKNNSWQTGADDESDPVAWEQRKQAGYQAMMEWLPIREQQNLKIWRDFSYGNLADIIMLDTRIWGRDAPADIGSPELADLERTIMGDDQEDWLAERLCASTAKWKVIGQQVMMVPFLIDGGVLNPDQWDGYPGSRQRFLDTLERCNVDDVVVLTGDIHTSWANDIPLSSDVYDPETGEGSRCVEYVCTSISSSGLGQATSVQELIIDFNPYIRWVDLTRRGYIVLDLTEDKAQAAWTHFETVATPDRAAAGESVAKVYSTFAGDNRLSEENEAAVGSGVVPDGAP
jgi:alkaline phosphatase D